jgi:hypothetical protein
MNLIKKMAAITDSGANIKKAIANLIGRMKHKPCFAHAVNLVAQNFCEHAELQPVLAAIKDIFKSFKQSVAASDQLRKQTNLKLIQSVPTRWNSTY